MDPPTSSNPTLSDELLTLNAIYGPQTLTRTPPPQSPSATTLTLALPIPSFSPLRLSFPPSYPDAPPTLHGCTPAAAHARALLEGVFEQGMPVVYALAEALVSEADAESPLDSDHDADAGPSRSRDEIEEEHKPGSVAGRHANAIAQVDPRTQPPEMHWHVSAALSEKSSTFVGRAARVSSRAEAVAAIEALCRADKKVGKATHNMWALRVRREGAQREFDGKGLSASCFEEESEADGESGAATFLARLLERRGDVDVLVLVSRWYGGIKLGGARWRCIGAVAGAALDALDQDTRNETHTKNKGNDPG